MASTFAQRRRRNAEPRRGKAKSSKKPATIGRPSERNRIRLSFRIKAVPDAFARSSTLVGPWPGRHHRAHETMERTLARPRALVIGGSVGGLRSEEHTAELQSPHLN